MSDKKPVAPGKDTDSVAATTGSEDKQTGASDGNNRRKGFTIARGIVCGLVFIAVAASLVWHTGGGTLSAFGIGSIAAVCPLGSLEAMLGSRDFMLHPLLLFGLAILLIIVFGKAFCSWVCPTPRLQKFFRPSGNKKADEHAVVPSVSEGEDGTSSSDSEIELHELGCAGKNGVSACGSCTACKPLPPVGGKRDGFHIDSRHGVLVGALASAAIFGFPVFCFLCPIGLTFATFIGLWHLLQFNETTWGLIIFPAILILEIVFLRKWCHRICPVSALLSLVSSANKTCKPKVNEEKCLRASGIDCHVCVDVCPEQVDPHSRRIPECTKCGVCIEACPAQAISAKLLPLSRKE